MLHKPTERKVPKKYEGAQKIEEPIKKQASKPMIRSSSTIPSHPRIPQKQRSVKASIGKVERKVASIANRLPNSQLQQILIEQIKGIKNELKQIKQHIGIQGAKKQSREVRKQESREEVEEEENIYNMKQNIEQRYQLQPRQLPVKSQKNKDIIVNNSNYNKSGSQTYRLYDKPKQLMQMGKIQPYMKQFKLEMSKVLLPFYHGYHKKSSKPVIIKYCPQNKTMEPLFNLYQKLWKNIVKSKSICLNKVYDLNQPLATYILVIEANKHSLQEILSMRIATVSQVLHSVLRALQFFHECGYLYRNIHPYHVMLSYQSYIVLIDLKNVKKFVDIKGKHMQIVNEGQQIENQFISNNRARKLKEGRKDDLQSLGYLALFILEGSLPWNINNLIQVRSKLTLKQLCGKYAALLEYMIVVSQMQTQDVPDYEKLANFLMNV